MSKLICRSIYSIILSILRKIVVLPVLNNLLCENVQTFVFSSVIFIVLCVCLHPARFSAHYSYIKIENIRYELEQAYFPSVNKCLLAMKTKSHSRLHPLYPDLNKKENSKALALKFQVLPGGHWRPNYCQPLFNVAIVLPYRNRESQLSFFINYIHPFLQSQNLQYRIFVVEQSFSKQFNRAKLFNVGFVEASKINDFHCFIFHDIDLIPQNLNNIYACTKMPRHMSSSVNIFRYNLPYKELFGGAIAITKHQFEQVNGFSNVYFGWGAEDDDFYNRLQSKDLPVTRFGPDVSQYHMLTHKKESPSRIRFTHLNSASKRFDVDGINNLDYNVLNYQMKPLYTWILVEI